MFHQKLCNRIPELHCGSHSEKVYRNLLNKVIGRWFDLLKDVLYKRFHADSFSTRSNKLLVHAVRQLSTSDSF